MSGQCTHKHPIALSNLIDPTRSHMLALSCAHQSSACTDRDHVAQVSCKIDITVRISFSQLVIRVRSGRKIPNNTENYVPTIVRVFSSGFSNTSAAQPSSTSFIKGVKVRIFYAENSKKIKTGLETGSTRLGADS